MNVELGFFWGEGGCCLFFVVVFFSLFRRDGTSGLERNERGGWKARKQGCRDEEGRMKMRGRAEMKQGEAGTE